MGGREERSRSSQDNLRIYTSIVLTVVGDLSPSTPNDLSTGGNHTKFTVELLAATAQ